MFHMRTGVTTEHMFDVRQRLQSHEPPINTTEVRSKLDLARNTGHLHLRHHSSHALAAAAKSDSTGVSTE